MRTITKLPVEYPFFNQETRQTELNIVPKVDGVTELQIALGVVSVVYWCDGCAYPVYLNYENALFLVQSPLNKLSDIDFSKYQIKK